MAASTLLLHFCRASFACSSVNPMPVIFARPSVSAGGPATGGNGTAAAVGNGAPVAQTVSAWAPGTGATLQATGEAGRLSTLQGAAPWGTGAATVSPTTCIDTWGWGCPGAPVSTSPPVSARCKAAKSSGLLRRNASGCSAKQTKIVMTLALRTLRRIEVTYRPAQSPTTAVAQSHETSPATRPVRQPQKTVHKMNTVPSKLSLMMATRPFCSSMLRVSLAADVYFFP
mmetsp:Transcript_77298/g.136311  ORF Transcript_77298/g.136311 Transcript_77298/m.136311 type:complete len:228 (+) Transcript_77298:324-1007(+)